MSAPQSWPDTLCAVQGLVRSKQRRLLHARPCRSMPCLQMVLQCSHLPCKQSALHQAACRFPSCRCAMTCAMGKSTCPHQAKHGIAGGRRPQPDPQCSTARQHGCSSLRLSRSRSRRRPPGRQAAKLLGMGLQTLRQITREKLVTAAGIGMHGAGTGNPGGLSSRPGQGRSGTWHCRAAWACPAPWALHCPALVSPWTAGGLQLLLHNTASLSRRLGHSRDIPMDLRLATSWQVVF